MPNAALDFEALMQEPPGGENHGYAITTDERGDRVRQPLSVAEMQAREFMGHGGWAFVDPRSRASAAGMTTHRGVNAPSDHIDLEHVHEIVEQNFGLTLAEIDAAYTNGRPTHHRAGIRAAIDARLLALSRAGGNLTALARVLGWQIEANGTCRKIDRALARARAAEGACPA